MIYRRYTASYAAITCPLTMLTLQKDSHFPLLLECHQTAQRSSRNHRALVP